MSTIPSEREVNDDFYVEVDTDGTRWLVDATRGSVDEDGGLDYARVCLTPTERVVAPTENEVVVKDHLAVLVAAANAVESARGGNLAGYKAALDALAVAAEAASKVID